MSTAASLQVVARSPHTSPGYLSFALKAFLLACEESFCPQWPVRTPEFPQRYADVAIEYRAERARRKY